MKRKTLCTLYMPVVLFFCSQGFSQTTTKYPKEVRVNWDKKLFEAPLPVDEPFILRVYSTNALPVNFVLMRYLETNKFYYYEQPIRKISTEAGVNMSSINKETHKTTTSAAGVATEVTTEYTEKPLAVTYNVYNYYVTPLRANFYYSLLDQTDYTTGTTASKAAIAISGVKVQKDKGSLTNTFLSFQDYAKRRVTAIIGIAYLNIKSKTVRPYLGLRYNFRPINRELQSKYYEKMHNEDARAKFANRFSFDVGITLGSIQDTVKKQFDLFGSSTLLTGLGYRVSDGFFLSAGAIWYNKKNSLIAPDNSLKIQNAWYISLSFDWDFSKSFDALKKSLGASF